MGNGDPDYDCALYFAREAVNAGVIVYTIGIGPGVNSDLLTAIATGIDPNGGAGQEFLFDACGGQFFLAAKPTDIEDILEALNSQPLTGCESNDEIKKSYYLSVIKKSSS